MKIILSLFLSFLIVIFLNQTIFFNGIPKINAEKIRRTAKNIRNDLIIFKNNLKYRLSKNKVEYNQLLSDYERPMSIEFRLAVISPTPTLFLMPIAALVPTQEIPIVGPTNRPSPTLTSWPAPTIICTGQACLTPMKIQKPTPTKKIKPSQVPIKPILEPNSSSEVPIINSPLSQPYYDPSKAYLCYNADKFIEVYADNVNPDACYNNIEAKMDSYMTSVSILGKSIQIHKKAYSSFKAVSDELSKNSVAKNYKINTIGAYVFRCNVNASTSDRNDTCSEGCVLSAHAFGIAVDINWDENCNGCSNYTMPMEIVDIFEKYGFRWGGRYKSVFGATIDPMHFEYMYDLCKDLNN